MQTLTTNRVIAPEKGPEPADLYREFGISEDRLATYRLPFHRQAETLVAIDRDIYGRTISVTPETAEAWRRMKEAAQHDGIALNAESGFRSVEHQAEIIRRELHAGTPIEKILERVALPYHSEHHSGRAIDIANNTSLIHDLGTDFEETREFRWLMENAGRFGFHLSYPDGNALGISYEPWHWCYAGTEAEAQVPFGEIRLPGFKAA